MINVTPHAMANPIELEQAVYDELVQRKQGGWSVCETEEEWLAKLHYLRAGKATGKIEEAAFLDKEKQLVIQWWKKWNK